MQIDYIEIAGVLTALLYLYLEIKQRLAMWVVGVVSGLLYAVVFYQAKFYADMGINIYYALAGIYGLYCWRAKPQSHPGSKPALRIHAIGTRQWLYILLACAAIWVLLYALLRYATDSPVPLGDAFTTTLGIVATIMVARKILQHWWLWVVANGVSVGLYCWRDLHLTAGLYAVYTLLSVYGYWRWRRQMQRHTTTSVDT